MVFIINAVLLLVAGFIVGWNFGLKTIFCVVIISLGMNFWQEVLPDGNFLGVDNLLAIVMGGILAGAGIALCFSQGGSTGGTDIVAKMLRRRYPYINFGTLLFGMNVVVVLTFAFLFKKYDSCMYTMIEMFISSKVVNLVLYGPGVSEVCYIITNNVNAIKSAITCTMGRGVTLLRGEGAWSGKEMQVILCVVKRPEIAQLREVVRSVDEHAFVIVSAAKEVFGRGFGNIYGDD